MADIHGNVLRESGADEFADRVLSGCFVRYAWEAWYVTGRVRLDQNADSEPSVGFNVSD
jgi:hypothetical protein